MLRELELLPMWKLRAPLSPMLADEPVVANKVVTESTQNVQLNVDYFVSENNAWVFICPVDRIDTASQSMLLDNLFNALQIKAKKSIVNLAEINAKMLIAMGEKTAQMLLNSHATMDDLRAKQHVLHNLPLIVTYSAAEMLEHLPNKAKTWHDLCTASNLAGD